MRLLHARPLAALALTTLAAACAPAMERDASTADTMRADAPSSDVPSRDSTAPDASPTDDTGSALDADAAADAGMASDADAGTTDARFVPNAARAVTEPGAINGAVLRAGYAAVHLVRVPENPPYGPVTGLASVATAEYATGVLMDDGRIFTMTPTGLAPLAVPAETRFRAYVGGLHHSIAVDTTGRVWTWGANDQGLAGTGSDGGTLDPHLVATDDTGAAFTDAVSAAGGYAYSGVVKRDGSVWLWGSLTRGLAGDGTMGRVYTRPVRVPLPAGVRARKLVFSTIATVFAEDGSVWTWGEADDAFRARADLGRDSADGTRPGRVTALPANVTDVVASQGATFALTADGHLWGWGAAGMHLGGYEVLERNSYQQATPVDLTSALRLPATIRSVAANDHAVYTVLADGSLWAWGDDAHGLVGDGQEIDYARPSPVSMAVYAWDWTADQLLVRRPVRIAPAVSNFRRVFTNTSYVFYAFALTDDGRLYSWGRNKTADLMNGIVPAAPVVGQIAAAYPNSWDVLVPTQVNPFQLARTVEVTSPYCEAHPTMAPCDTYRPR